MKKVALSLLLCLSLLLPLGMSACSFEEVTRLYVYNWGEYMSLEGGEDGVHVNHAFEEWYYDTYGERVEVVYSVFSSNEEMYAKMRNGSSKIDLIIPSEYMVERLKEEGMLLELDFSLIPAYEEAIEARFQSLDTADVCVPYTYGYLGLIYDASLDESLRDENGEISWRVLWNEIPDGTDLSGNILTFNNSRDAFGIAQFLLNYEMAKEKNAPLGTDYYVNSTDTTRWDEAYELLRTQRACLQAYVMDEIYNKMESGAALLAPYYAGDYFTMVDVNEDLCFAYPKEGTNFFYDAMCVPKTAKNPELAQIYINFLLGGTNGENLDVAIANAEYICYSSPNLRVSTNLDYLATMTDDEEGYGEEALSILYPEADLEALDATLADFRAWRTDNPEADLEEYTGAGIEAGDFIDADSEFVTYIYQNLSAETLEYANGRWEALKLESAPCTDIYILSGMIVAALAGIAIYFGLRRRLRRRFYG